MDRETLRSTYNALNVLNESIEQSDIPRRLSSEVIARTRQAMTLPPEDRGELYRATVVDVINMAAEIRKACRGGRIELPGEGKYKFSFRGRGDPTRTDTRVLRITRIFPNGDNSYDKEFQSFSDKTVPVIGSFGRPLTLEPYRYGGDPHQPGELYFNQIFEADETVSALYQAMGLRREG